MPCPHFDVKTHKSEIVHTEIMLPPHAPRSYADRNTLWNAAEAIEKQWNGEMSGGKDRLLRIQEKILL